ncbi:MAG TPA: hypothetical protein VFJ51_00105 [Nitrososphaeraceae archaeon]|nr:hypothetical protein [Nitrososphaeraceae archaeon]
MGNVSYFEDPKRMGQTVKFLKTMIANPEYNVEEGAKEVDMAKGTAYDTIYDYIAIYQNSVDHPNFPDDLLRFYNSHSQSDDETLTHEEVIASSKIRHW